MRRPADATAALIAAATELGPIDIRLARDIVVEAVVQAQINGPLAPDGATPADVARVARSLPLPAGTPATVGDLLLDADTMLQLEGLRAAAVPLRLAISAVRHEAGTAPETLRWLAAACADATILADDIALHELAWRMVAQAREQGAAIALSLALSHAGVSELLAGLLPEAERCFHERVAIEEAHGRDWSIGPLLVAAWRGQAEQARVLLDTVTTEAARQGQGYQLPFAGYARCVLELGRGRYGQAYASLAGGIHDGSQIKFALPDLVEAAARSGQHDAAQQLAGQLARLAEASPVPHLGIPRAVLAERLASLTGEGVLSGTEGAHGHTEYVLTSKGLTLWPVLRSLLAWGDEHYSEGGPRRVFQHTADGGPVGSDGTCAACGRSVPVQDLLVSPGPGLAGDPHRPSPRLPPSPIYGHPRVPERTMVP